MLSLLMLFSVFFSNAREVSDSIPDNIVLVDTIAADIIAIEPAPADTLEFDSTLPIASVRPELTDSVVVPAKDSPDWWINRIKAHDYNIYDPTIKYPKFLNFCVNLYRWGNKTFNTYDNEYVLPTGKNWKLMGRSSNWTDSYAMHFSPNVPIRMLSNVYASLGVYLSFMAVSAGYSINLSKLLGYESGTQKRFDFNFNTALFTVDAFYTSNDGGTIIRQFGDYEDGHLIHIDFPSLKLKSYGMDAYYFLNNKRYSQGAVYNFSKYQLKSQGSFIFGVSIGHYSIKMDFSSLSPSVLEYLPDERRKYNFIYNDFSLLAGYGFNCVLGHNWVYNITVLPTVGMKHTFPESIEGSKTRLSLGVRGKTAIVYNVRNFFLGIEGDIRGQWHINPGFYFFNSIITFGGNVGFRF